MQGPHKSEYTYNHDLSALDLSLFIVFPAKRDIAFVSAELNLFALCDHLTVQQPCIEMRPLSAPANRPYVKENELIATISERIGEELTEENASMLKKVLIEMEDISIEYADNIV